MPSNVAVERLRRLFSILADTLSPLQRSVRGQPFWRGRPWSQLALLTLADSSTLLTLGDPPILTGTLAIDQPVTKRNRRHLADPAHPPSALVVEAIWDRDAEASARQPLLGRMRLGQLLTILTLTLPTTALWDLSQFGSAELDSTDQRAIAPPPMPLFPISLAPVDAEKYY